jgi:hypothetical protein
VTAEIRPVPAPSIETSEELREALITLRTEHEALMKSSQHAQQLLDGLEALLDVELGDDPFARVFISLRKVFTYSHALLLTEHEVDPASSNASPRNPLRCSARVGLWDRCSTR